MITVSYIVKIKIKEIFFEVISHTKILFNEIVNDQRFCQTYRDGLDKRGTGQRRIWYMILDQIQAFIF